jgi:hypothetical protein
MIRPIETINLTTAFRECPILAQNPTFCSDPHRYSKSLHLSLHQSTSGKIPNIVREKTFRILSIDNPTPNKIFKTRSNL